MNAYSGKEPFAFVSYSHMDRDIVEPIIMGLKRKMCRVWYDEGLTPGESWNDDIAEHIKNCDCFILMLSKSSVESKYVKAEINYALSKDKKVLPVLLEDTKLPAGIEMMISTYQFLSIFGKAEMAQVNEIAQYLPSSVFSGDPEPFFDNGEYAIYLKTEVIEKPNTDLYNCVVVGSCHKTGEQRELFRFNAPGSFDVTYKLTQCKMVNDDFFVGETKGITIFNILAYCSLCYPLYGPDFDVLMIFALRTPKNEFPTVHLIDYQYFNIINSANDGKEIVKDAPWGCFFDEALQKLLYK